MIKRRFTFIHCLLMAEFWDGEQLYDIAFDLFSTSSRVLKMQRSEINLPLLIILKFH